MDQTTDPVRRRDLPGDDEDQVAIAPIGSASSPTWADQEVLAVPAETTGARRWGDENLDAGASDAPVWRVAGVDKTASPFDVAGVDSSASAFDAGDVAVAGGAAVAGDDETEEIRAEIEQTRSDLSATIDAIQEKLNPQSLMTQAMDQAKETVREATVGRVEQMVNDASNAARDTGSGVIDLIKQNPLPAAAVGLGIGWLLTRGGSSGRDSYPYEWSGPRGGGSYYPQQYWPGHATGTIGTSDYAQGLSAQRTHWAGRSEGNRGQSQGPLDQVAEIIRANPLPAAVAGLSIGWLLLNGSGGSNGGQMLNQVQEKVGGTMDQAGRRVGHVAGQVQETVGDTIGEAQDTVGQVASQAQETAGQLVDTVQQVAGDVRERAGDVAYQAQQTVGEVAHQAQQAVGEVTHQAQDVVGQLIDVVRRNPLPAAIAGLSIGWLLMNNSSNRRGDRLVNMARGTVEDTVSTAQDAVGSLADQTQEKAQEAQTRLQVMLQENPLGVGLVAAALGAAVGLAVPQTPGEHQLMGEVRDNLLDSAQEAAQDAMHRVQRVAEEAQQGAQRAAEDEGLTQ